MCAICSIYGHYSRREQLLASYVFGEAVHILAAYIGQLTWTELLILIRSHLLRCDKMRGAVTQPVPPVSGEGLVGTQFTYTLRSLVSYTALIRVIPTRSKPTVSSRVHCSMPQSCNKTITKLLSGRDFSFLGCYITNSHKFTLLQ